MGYCDTVTPGKHGGGGKEGDTWDTVTPGKHWGQVRRVREEILGIL